MTRPAPTDHRKYVDIERLKNADGLVAIISQRVKSGELTFGIFREFEDHSGAARTTFVPEWLGESWLQLAQLTMETIKTIKQTGIADGKPLPYPVGVPGRRSYRSTTPGRQP